VLQSLSYTDRSKYEVHTNLKYVSNLKYEGERFFFWDSLSLHYWHRGGQLTLAKNCRVRRANPRNGQLTYHREKKVENQLRNENQDQLQNGKSHGKCQVWATKRSLTTFPLVPRPGKTAAVLRSSLTAGHRTINEVCLYLQSLRLVLDGRRPGCLRLQRTGAQ